MRGATASVAGSRGIVPKPTAGQHNFMLLGDGTWGAQPVAGLPSQTSNSGKLLTTDGTNAAWTTTAVLTSLTSPASIDLTLAGGSSGASLVLGQGASGVGLLTVPDTNDTRALSLKQSTNTATAHLGLFSNSLYIGQNYYYSTGNVIPNAIRTSGAIVISTGTTANSGNIDFNLGTVNTAPSTLARLTGTGNLLIGTTTDMTGSGGLKVAGTTAASSTTSGALQVGSNVGLSGNAGGTSYFGGAINSAGSISVSASGQSAAKYEVTNTDTTSYSHIGLTSATSQASRIYQFGSAYTTSGRYIQGSMLLESGGTGGLNLATSAATPLRFYTNGDNLRLTIDSAGAATFAGAVNGTTAAFSGTITNAKSTSTVASGAVSVMAGTSAVAGILQEWKTNTSSQRAYIGTADQVVSGGTIADFAIDATSGNLVLSTAQTTRATISSTGATFAGAVSVSGTAATWTSGTSSPESVKTAPVGSLYTRTDGGASTTLYVKESGAGNTGWIAK